MMGIPRRSLRKPPAGAERIARRWGSYVTEGGAGRIEGFDFHVSYGSVTDVYAPPRETCNGYAGLLRELRRRASAEFRPQRRRGLLAVFLSHCDRRRVAYVQQLMKFLPGLVDSYGSCLHNVGANVTRHSVGAQASKVATLRGYKFAFAFENHIEPSYVTEKVFDAFIGGAVPVYHGASNVGAFVPTNSSSSVSSLILAKDYPNAAALARRLKELDGDDDAYLDFHRGWDLEAYQQSRFAKACEVNWLCRVCDYLQTQGQD
mmetsp:Transcript_8215/g.23380  ORF Transcript_8215/g.23380 Transcript_8215/m.23380 type:complete len:261 (+) Transcript_8215:144-926(+)